MGEARPGGEGGRLPLIDGLRGVAAVAVMLHHFYVNGVFDGGRLRAVTPAPLDWLLRHGHLGVVIFFGLSGFVIAHSLAGRRLTPSRAGNFLLRRSVRLDPPYFATIALVVAVNAASNPLLKNRQVPFPSAGFLSSHLVYLQELIYGRSLLGVFWTLCLEIQLYLSFAVLAVLAHALVRRAGDDEPGRLDRVAVWLVSPVAVGSLYWPLSGVPEMPRSGWLFFYWYLFLLGVYARWAWADRVARWVLGGLLAGVAVAAVWGDERAAAGVLTVGVILAGLATGGVRTWLNWRWLQYLGGVSYSLYLLHDVFGVRLLNLATRLPDRSLLVELGLLTAATTASLVAAHLLNRLVERPFVALSRRLKPAGRPPTDPTREGMA